MGQENKFARRLWVDPEGTPDGALGRGEGARLGVGLRLYPEGRVGSSGDYKTKE